MVNPEQLDWYRRMTPRERTRLMLELMDLGWSILRRQGPDAVARAREGVAALHRSSCRALVAGLEHAENLHVQTPIPRAD